jgi:phosphatidylcholine synthase
VWNLAAFYLYLLEPPPWAAAAGIAALAALTFVPIRFVHPLRVKHLRWLNIALMAVWAGLAAFALAENLSPALYVTWALAAIAVYFLIAGLLRKPA